MLTTVVAGRTFDYSHAVGGLYMPMPVSVACGSGDAVYVVSRQYEQILDVPWNETATYAQVNVFSITTTPNEEEHLRKISRYGDGEGRLIWPAGVALDTEENVYITDEWMNRVSVFTSEGDFLRSWGTAGSGDCQFNRPSGIAFDSGSSDGTLLVADSLNHRVQRLNTDGQFVSAFGTYGSSDGQLDSPWGITTDSQGFIYVADHKNHRAQKFTAEGEFVMSFGSFGTGKGQLTRPSDVAVDPDGDVYVCDWANNRVQVFAPDGRYLTTLLGDAHELAKWHREQVEANADVEKARRRVYTMEPEWRFAMPTGLVFDEAKSRLIVTDTQRGRVQIYNKLQDYMEPQFNL